MQPRYDGTMLAALAVAAALGVFALANGEARGQTVNPVPPLPPPVFNPSSPNTVPQPSEAPVSPSAPGTLGPAPEIVSPSATNPPDATIEPHRPAATVTTARHRVATPRRIHHRGHYRYRSSRRLAGGVIPGAVAAPYYFSPYGWGYGPYPCMWQRHSDGYWVRNCGL